MSDPIETEINEAKGKSLGDIDVNGTKFAIVTKPDSLLLAELSRTGTGDPEAFGVLAEFFEVTLGKEGYREFKKAVRASDLGDEGIMGKLQEILEKTMGRPTE